MNATYFSLQILQQQQQDHRGSLLIKLCRWNRMLLGDLQSKYKPLKLYLQQIENFADISVNRFGKIMPKFP